MIRKAVIPAAGYGTRNLPVTKSVPKEMFPISGKPALHYIVEEAAGAGIREILIIVSRGKNAIIDYFDKSVELEHHLRKQGKPHLMNHFPFPDMHIQYVRQPEALGLGGAVRLAEPFVGNEPFALLLPDDLLVDGVETLNRMIRVYEVYKRPVIGLRRLEDKSQLRNYGVVQGEWIAPSLVQIAELIEKPVDKPPSDLAVLGRYILPPEIFSYIKSTKPGNGGEVQLTDALRAWLQTAAIYGMEIKEQCYDISKTNEYIELQWLMYQKQLDTK
ncbi:UTP--glucose-1-phosphate uridylyltransferase [Cohnella sp.]|uniref:UTP--glucose-1-phosphate uridylyltransferase n=1 Tax=Cohnella sp. TaxID=1883426 RepID=UPI003561B699